ESHGNLIGRTVSVQPCVGAEERRDGKPEVSGQIERQPEQRAAERIDGRHARTEVADLVAVVEIAIEDERVELAEVGASVTGSTLEPEMKQDDEAERQGQGDQTARVEPRALPRQPRRAAIGCTTGGRA